MKPVLLITAALLIIVLSSYGQDRVDSFRIAGDVEITLDIPGKFTNRETIVIMYALPNGNSTEQTMGKKLLPGDDWHYDIQHIRAQTGFIREKLAKNIIVVYLENDYRSWPLWKQKHSNYRQLIPHIVDSVFSLIPPRHKTMYLNGHSGGGSFVFGYLEGLKKIPAFIERIGFLDSNYGYDSSYYPKLKKWLNRKDRHLTVFAYNDSVALYNGNPVVSEKGGTWYKSHLMKEHFEKNMEMEEWQNDSLIVFESRDKKIAFFLKPNPERKIFHTQQVELNGFIHSVLYATEKENEGYEYFGQRAYAKFIK